MARHTAYVVKAGDRYLADRSPLFGLRWSGQQRDALWLERAEAKRAAERANARVHSLAARVVRLVRRAK